MLDKFGVARDDPEESMHGIGGRGAARGEGANLPAIERRNMRNCFRDSKVKRENAKIA
jgi:hypothetical protein